MEGKTTSKLLSRLNNYLLKGGTIYSQYKQNNSIMNF